MSPITSNIQLAEKCLESLISQGVKDFIVCAGARNAPLVRALSAKNISSKDFFDERSAAFFALGRARVLKSPVAIITTSGTAAAEVLPAMVEAYYSQVPLVAVTADRPKSYRSTGAPQAIEQSEIFGIYATRRADWDQFECEGFELAKNSPSHLNICFDEPQSKPEPEHRFTKVLEFSAVKNPLVVVSQFEIAHRESIIKSLLSWQVPVYLEAVSELRSCDDLKNLMIPAAGEALSAQVFEKYFDSVIRIGSVPTLRLWRDLDLSLSHVPVVNFSDRPFSGLARVRDLPNPLSHVSKIKFTAGQVSQYFAVDKKNYTALNIALNEFPTSEPAMMRKLSEQIPKNSKVFLGNSLPIREWDLAALDNNFTYSCNRGANGIDGIISSFLGELSAGVENWLILGDLSALYDLTALWALREIPKCKLRIVIINNGGGRIFKRVFNDKKFENEHQINFKNWAEMFQVDYVSGWPLDLGDHLSDRVIIELSPDNLATEKFWQQFQGSI